MISYHYLGDIGDDLFQFDDIIDQSVNKEATIEIYRNGVKKTTVCRVDDANYFNVTKFALINGRVYINRLNNEAFF
jgi:hypothetical protein